LLKPRNNDNFANYLIKYKRHMKKLKAKQLLIFTTLIIVVVFSSCTSQKNLVYFQNKELDSKIPNTQIHKYKDGETNYSPNYTLKENDMLYVNIYSSVDEETSKLFAGTNAGGYSSQQETSIFLNSYQIDSKGEINLPVIGGIYVKGMTIEQAQDAIKAKAEEYSKGIVVTCKMVTFKIDVVGEVTRPGTYTFYQPSVNIFDVISAAGDLTYYGNRSKIRVIRKTQTEDMIYTLDIRKSNVMQTPQYYLQPGDIVYIEPNKNTKTLTAINIPLATVSAAVSVLSTVLTLIVVFKK
jgi:polysaccharide biosynthesis/export protein